MRQQSHPGAALSHSSAARQKIAPQIAFSFFTTCPDDHLNAGIDKNPCAGTCISRIGIQYGDEHPFDALPDQGVSA